MYTQFFGNYLLNNGYITSEQLIKALDIHRNHFVKLGVLAIHGGYMTSTRLKMSTLLRHILHRNLEK